MNRSSDSGHPPLDAGLIRRGILTASDLADLGADLPSEPTARGRALVDAGRVTEADMLPALGEIFHMEVAVELPTEVVDPTLVDPFTVDWLRAHELLPIRWAGRIRLAMARPSDVSAIEDAALLLGGDPEPLLAPRETIRRLTEHAFFQRTGPHAEWKPAPAGAQPSEASPESADLLSAPSEAPVIRWVNNLLLEALRMNASDVHIEPLEKTVRVRIRVDGLLRERPAPPPGMLDALVSRIKVMAHMDIAERRLPQDGVARVRVGERDIDIRVATAPVGGGERVVLRLLHRASALLPLADLGMPEPIREGFRAALREPHGVILVTGPTGSGKTTTLYAALRELDTDRLNVMTVEDPVEYRLPNISQIQVMPRIGLTFAQGLRHLLRQDPDVLLVGETRDAETAEILLRASMTGHLVFSTLHTNDALSAAPRLADMGVDRSLVAASLRGVLAQRLVRTLCPRCAETVRLTPEDAVQLGCSPELAGKPLRRARGCPACFEGYRGRTGLYAWLPAGERVRDLIRANAEPSAWRALADRHTGFRLHEDALGKLLAGVTDVNEVVRVLGVADSES